MSVIDSGNGYSYTCGDPRPDDHAKAGMVPHDLPDAVCEVCGYASCARPEAGQS